MRLITTIDGRTTTVEIYSLFEGIAEAAEAVSAGASAYRLEVDGRCVMSFERGVA